MPSRSRHQLANRRWWRLRRVILERADWRCEACGARGDLEVDHKRPMARGGAAYDPANLQALCRPCHIAKTAQENRERRGAQLRRSLDEAGRKWRDMVCEMSRDML